MKIIKNLATSLCVLALTYSCSTDDSVADPVAPPASESFDLITTLTDGSEKVWKIESAKLNNNQVSDLDVTELVNVKDDELTFTLDGADLQLRHNFGLQIDTQESDIDGVLSDTNKSSQNRSLSLSSEMNQVNSSTNDYIITTDDQDRIIATISASQGAILEVELSPKTAQDYPDIPTSISTPLTLFTFEGAQPNYDIDRSIANTSIYVLGRLDNTSQQLIQYDLTTNSTQLQIMEGQNYFSQQIALIEDEVVSISYSEATSSPLDLSSDPITRTLLPKTDHAAVATLDNTLYAAGGFNGDFQDFLGFANLDDNDFSSSFALPSPRTVVGLEIIDNVAYVLGGQDMTTPEDGISATNDGFYVDLDSGDTGLIDLPTNTWRTYSARYQNLIYIAGRTVSSDTQAPYNYFGVFDTRTNELTEINIANQLPYDVILRSFTVLNGSVYFLVQDTNDVPTNNTFALKVMEANFNY